MADTPLAQQAEAKAEAKMDADHAVAVDPHAVHGVKTMIKSPPVIASTIAGALAGAAIAPGVGVLAGAAAGYLIERHRLLGGPVGRLMSMLKRG